MHHEIVKHFIENQKSLGNLGLGGHLNFQKHGQAIVDQTKPYYENLHKKIQTLGGSSIGGSYIGGDLTGGSSIGGDITTPKQTYHHLLTMKPHQFEMHREIASQLLGGHHSPMWGKLTRKEDKLQAKPEDYENIIRMPSTHAAAKLVEAEHGTGGGFWKAVSHVGKLAQRAYSIGHNAVHWAGKNRHLINAMLPKDYRGHFNTFLDVENAAHQLAGPIVSSAAKSLNVNLTPDMKNALDTKASQSIQAVLQNQPISKPKLPEANMYH